MSDVCTLCGWTATIWYDDDDDDDEMHKCMEKINVNVLLMLNCISFCKFCSMSHMLFFTNTRKKQ